MTRAPFDAPASAPPVDATALEGRPLIAASNETRGRCTRCLRKNAIRRALDRPDLARDPSFADGARVRLLARWSGESADGTAIAGSTAPAGGTATDDGTASTTSAAWNTPPEQLWRVTDCFHADHPLPPREELARPGVAQACVFATVRAAGWSYDLTPGDPTAVEYDPDALVIEDVEIEWESPPDEGTPPPGTSVAPETGLHVLAPDEPRPDWPAETDAWRERFVRRERSVDGDG